MLADDAAERAREVARHGRTIALDDDVEIGGCHFRVAPEVADHPADQERVRPDRKSTRLNSSHDQISYAVFCLKKKKRKRYTGILSAPLLLPITYYHPAIT